MLITEAIHIILLQDDLVGQKRISIFKLINVLKYNYQKIHTIMKTFVSTPNIIL
jgi:hypothetical protein